jgi:hypothetical protein
MVVDVAGDALLDSPVVYFGPLLFVESSRGTHAPRTPVQSPSAPSFCSPRCRLISLTLVRARPAARLTDRPHFTTILLLLLLLLPHRTTTRLLPATPATLSPRSLSSISYRHPLPHTT